MCTNFKYPKAADGTVCVGRTMEFANGVPWDLVVLAADRAGKSAVGTNAKTWTGRYGVVGASALGNADWMADGMNTAGLSAHLLYMPGHATYYEPRNDGTDISIIESVSFLLSTCASTAEARDALEGCNVVTTLPPGVPMTFPLHVIVHDAENCLVAEFHPDGMTITDNPTQVATNAPWIEWHLTNVANYLSLSPENPEPVEIGGTTFSASGQGQGFRGLPADESAASRFIRVLTNVRFADQPADRTEAELGAVRMLHGFDLVPGTVMEQGPDGKPTALLTVWSTVCNLTDKRFLFNTMSTTTWWEVDLNATDFSQDRMADLPTHSSFTALSL